VLTDSANYCNQQVKGVVRLASTLVFMRAPAARAKARHNVQTFVGGKYKGEQNQGVSRRTKSV
jgi:hypothetical protein